MKNNRKEIDDFLIHLNKYIESKELNEKQKLDLVIGFRIEKPSTFWPKKVIPLSAITELINVAQRNKYREWIRTRRWSNYLRRVAYKMEYQVIKWDRYEEIFNRFLWIQKKWLILKDFYLDYGKDFIIPTFYWEINNDKLYKEPYNIIK